ncbi:MAG TPA: hypothetical protein VFZ02_13475 [Ktedonobacteraceae bacterium]
MSRNFAISSSIVAIPTRPGSMRRCWRGLGSVSSGAGRAGSFALVPSESAGKAPYSLMTWYVDDLATEMAALRSLGVTFEEYDWPWLKTVNGVANLDGNQLAWFKDGEGNLLALAQLLPAS